MSEQEVPKPPRPEGYSAKKRQGRGPAFHLSAAAMFLAGLLCLGASAVMLQLTWVYGTGGWGWGISPVVPLVGLIHGGLGAGFIAAASACWAMKRPPGLACGLLAGCGALVMLAAAASPIGRASLLVPMLLGPGLVLGPLGAWGVARTARTSCLRRARAPIASRLRPRPSLSFGEPDRHSGAE